METILVLESEDSFVNDLIEKIFKALDLKHGKKLNVWKFFDKQYIDSSNCTILLFDEKNKKIATISTTNVESALSIVEWYILKTKKKRSFNYSSFFYLKIFLNN